MNDDVYTKRLIPMGEYGGVQSFTVPIAVEDEPDTFNLDLDMVTLTVNDSVMSFSSEYAPTLEYVFTCPLLLNVNKWIHETDEEKLIRNETMTRLREQKLLFAVSQDSISDGLLSQLALKIMIPVPKEDSVPSPYTELDLSPSTLLILRYSNGYSVPLSQICDTVATELSIDHMMVEDLLADELPSLVSGRFVSVHFSIGKEDSGPTDEEKAELDRFGKEYEEKEKLLLNQYDEEAEAAYKAEIEAAEQRNLHR